MPSTAPRKRNSTAPRGAKRTEEEEAPIQDFSDGRPLIPGAQEKPVIGKADSPEEKKAKKKRERDTRRVKPPADEVEASDRYMKQKTAGALSAHARKINRVKELQRLLQPLTPSLLQVMSDIAHDKKVHPAIRLDAADRLMNRLYGKPTEKLEISEPEDEASTDEVKTMLNRILESVGAPLLEYQDGETPGENGNG